MSKKRVSPIPNTPKGADAASRRWMEAVKEALDVRLGRRGDPNEAAVTFNDLIEGGVVTTTGRLNVSGLPTVTPPPSGPGYLPAPVVPLNFEAVGVFGGVHLVWDTPAWEYNVTITEIKRHTVNDLTQADLLASTNGSSYFDIILDDGEVTFYYWIRHINATGVAGPWSGTKVGTKPPDVDFILGELAGKISGFELDNDINLAIDLITAPDTTPGSVNARIDALRQTIVNEDYATSSEVNQVQANIGPAVAAAEQRMEVEVQRVDGEIDTIKSLYSVSVNSNGVAGGFYLAADGSLVQARWDVDRFVLGRANGSAGVYPFVYDASEGAIFLDTVVIREASIQEGQLGPITIGKLSKNDGTPITTVAGLIKADAIDVNNLTVAEASTFTGVAQSANFQPDTLGWMLNPITGDGEINFPISFSNITGAPGPGVNYVAKHEFSDGDVGTWGPGTSVAWGSGGTIPFLKVERRATIEEGNSFGVIVGQKYRVRFYAYTASALGDVGLGLMVTKSDGSIDWLNNPVASGVGESYVTIPSGAIKASPYVLISAQDPNTGWAWVNDIEITRLSAEDALTRNWVKPNKTTIDGAKITTGYAYVDTLEIKGQAVNIPVGGYIAGSSGFWGNASKNWHTMISVSITSTGNPIMVSASAAIGNATSFLFDVQVKRGSSVRYYAPDSIGATTAVFAAPAFKDHPGAGTHTYYFQVRFNTSKDLPGNKMGEWLGRSMTLMEVKR